MDNCISFQKFQNLAMSYQDYNNELVASVGLRLEKLLPLLSSSSYGDTTLNELAMLCNDIKVVGPLLDISHRQKMDDMQTVFTKICQDMKISVKLRLKVLEVIELRTLDWITNEAVDNYYKEKFALIEKGKSRSTTNFNDKLRRNEGHAAVQKYGDELEGCKNVVQALQAAGNLQEERDRTLSRGPIMYSRNDILTLANSPHARVQPMHWSKVVSTLPKVIVKSPSDRSM